MRGARLHRRLRMEGLQKDWRDLRNLSAAWPARIGPLARAIFTPSTKATTGHDENISFQQTIALLGRDLAERVKNVSLEIYYRASEYAAERGIIIADTKFEFGILDKELIWIDEALTPDSSRFWPADQYSPGSAQPSFDKQFVRDYLERVGWNKQAPWAGASGRCGGRHAAEISGGLPAADRKQARLMPGDESSETALLRSVLA